MGSQFSAKRRAPHQTPPCPSTALTSPISILRRRRVVQIDELSDDVLLEIFDFYLDMSPSYERKPREKAWQSLVHVCRRWRGLVLGSPRRLDLQLYCTPETPTRDALNVWPALPLVVKGFMALSGTDNIIAALEQSNRVSHVSLSRLAGWQLEQVSAAMHVPFPELSHLELFSDGESMPVIPDSFLGVSAPRLRHFKLDGIPFPGLPKPLLAAARLVDLHLFNIPHSGYISPEAIVALISVLSSLEQLSLEFQSPQSGPDRETRRPPPSERPVIPALHYFKFKGVTEYLEDLATRIDTPQLDDMQITFFNQIDFDTRRLAQFVNRTPKSGKRDATVQFYDHFARIGLSPGTLDIFVSCRKPDWQVSSIEQVCNSFLHPLSIVEDLYIENKYLRVDWKNYDIENSLWLQLLLPFAAVKNLFLSRKSVPRIAAALQELVGDRITDMLPSLQNIFVERPGPGSLRETIGQFVDARRLSDRAIAISVWDRPEMLRF